MATGVSSARLYGVVFGGLLLLTALTVGLAYVELGRWHGAVGLLIASAKAALVGTYFMHLNRSGRLVWLVAGAAVFWLAILLGLTLTDYLTRDWMEASGASRAQ